MLSRLASSDRAKSSFERGVWYDYKVGLVNARLGPASPTKKISGRTLIRHAVSNSLTESINSRKTHKHMRKPWQHIREVTTKNSASSTGSPGYASNAVSSMCHVPCLIPQWSIVQRYSVLTTTQRTTNHLCSTTTSYLYHSWRVTGGVHHASIDPEEMRNDVGLKSKHFGHLWFGKSENFKEIP